MWMMWHMADWTHSNPFLTEACCDPLFSVLTPLRHRVRRHVLPQKWTAWWLGIYAGYIMVIVDIMGIIQSWNIQMPDGVWYFTFEIDARKLPRSLLKKIAESSVSDDWACLAVLHFFLVLTWETCLLVWWRLKAFRSELLFANHVSQYWKIYCQHLRQDCQAATFMNMETLTSEPPSCFVGMDFIDFHYLGALGLGLTSWPFGNALAAGYGENNFQHHHSADPSRIHKDMICQPPNDPNDRFRKGQDSFTFRLLLQFYLCSTCDNSLLGESLRKNKHR